MFERRFWGDAPLDKLQNACIDVSKDKTAALISLEGRQAKRPDGTAATINIVRFEPKDDESEVKDDITLILKNDAGVEFFGEMASAGKTQIGDHDGMTVFINSEPQVILVFAKTTHSIIDIN
jgi:hypothetical protein